MITASAAAHASSILPRVLFVLGKGGVGRSTVAVALARELARRGERVLVFGWTVSDPIAPWFGLPPAGLVPTELEPRVAVANFRLDETLRMYFVDHLGLRRLHAHVIDSAPVQKLIAAAPGIAELFFVGHLWWLSTLAKEEAGLDIDRIVVDAPATGHGVSLLDIPSVLTSLHAAGLLATESERVNAMMADPTWTGAYVVTLAEELAAEETVELVPRVTQRLGRRPLAVFVNRSVGELVSDREDASPAPPGWISPSLSAPARAALETVRAELRGRARFEAALRGVLGASATQHGLVALGEQLLRSSAPLDPRGVLAGLEGAVARHVDAVLGPLPLEPARGDTVERSA